MWQLAAKSLSHFPEVIVTALGTDSYPISIRQRSPRYDAGTGEMPVLVPASIALVPGPANVLGHYHDDYLWNLRIVRITGRLERRGDDWIFITTAFTPPPGTWRSTWHMAKTMRRNSQRYLATRGMQRPRVNWAAIKSLQRQAQP